MQSKSTQIHTRSSPATLTSNPALQLETKWGELLLKTLRLTHLGAVNNKLAFLYLLLSPLCLSPRLPGEGGRRFGEQGLWVLKWLLLCDVYYGLRIQATNYTVRDTSMCDEEEEKLQMFTIEHLQWLVIQEAWLLLLKCGPESIRGIIRVVRAN